MLIYLVALFTLLFIIYYNDCDLEHFNISDMSVCNECSCKSKLDCMACNNCGYCNDEYGNGRCVSGDKNGPYFDSCNSWNNIYNMVIEQPFNSYYTYQEPNYRRYYGNNQGRRRGHHVF